MQLFEELKWRGLIKDITNEEEIKRLLNEEQITFYWGTDPSGDSLHLGHFSSLLLAKRLKEKGHHPILLVGGATGLIGDPRPTTERAMIEVDAVQKNYDALKKQVQNLFGYDMVNNYDWSKEINFLSFLRDFGKYFNVNYMLDKDIVRRRLETGITYTEFSYMIMQALDFLHLYETRNCVLQVAGSDQWGNITAGVDLIKRKLGKDAYAFTMPLILDKDGNKFGKSEGNALYLNINKTSSYELYQYLVNTDDSMVIHYLKIFTFLSKEEIETLEVTVQKEPHLRIAQKRLAEEIITFLHGKEEYDSAVQISNALFSGNVKELSIKQIEEGFSKVPSFVLSEEKELIDVLVETKIVGSKREAREFFANHAIRINDEIVEDEHFMINQACALHKKYMIIKRGKKNYYLIQLV